MRGGGGKKNELFQASAISPGPFMCFFHINTVTVKTKQTKFIQGGSECFRAGARGFGELGQRAGGRRSTRTLFLLILLRISASFQNQSMSCTDRSGFAPALLCQGMKTHPPQLAGRRRQLLYFLRPPPPAATVTHLRCKSPRDIFFLFAQQTTLPNNRHKSCRADLEMVFQTTK